MYNLSALHLKFDLVLEEKQRSRYFGDVALTGHDTSFPCRFKSEIIAIIQVPQN